MCTAGLLKMMLKCPMGYILFFGTQRLSNGSPRVVMVRKMAVFQCPFAVPRRHIATFGSFVAGSMFSVIDLCFFIAILHTVVVVIGSSLAEPVYSMAMLSSSWTSSVILCQSSCAWGCLMAIQFCLLGNTGLSN